jgi:hypothetical protein
MASRLLHGLRLRKPLEEDDLPARSRFGEGRSESPAYRQAGVFGKTECTVHPVE